MFGTLLLRDRDAAAGERAAAPPREIHGVADVAVLEEVAQRVGDHDGAVLLGLAGRSAEVRQRDRRSG